MKPIVQIFLDLTNTGEALRMAHMAIRAGVEWLEVGTPRIITDVVRVLREEFEGPPIVADLETMDGCWLGA